MLSYIFEESFPLPPLKAGPVFFIYFNKVSSTRRQDTAAEFRSKRRFRWVSCGGFSALSACVCWVGGGDHFLISCFFVLLFVGLSYLKAWSQIMADCNRRQMVHCEAKVTRRRKGQRGDVHRNMVAAIRFASLITKRERALGNLFRNLCESARRNL